MKGIPGCIVLLLLLHSGESAGQSPVAPAETSPVASLTNDVFDSVSVNNIFMWFSSNGSAAHNPGSDGAGFEWPRGSGKHCIFADGLVYAGKADGEFRAGGATYRYGWQAGGIESDGEAADPSDPAFRIYKARRITRAEFDVLPPREQERLRRDFTEWPAGGGAPIFDEDGNGQYDPDFNAWLSDSSAGDKPLYPGDEALWFVSNDLDPTRTATLYGTPPVGLEIRTIVWAFRNPAPLDNAVFVKHTLINRGASDFEDVYFARWTDPDLGDGLDDLVGVDTTRNMAFVYNGRTRDGGYGDPPALGIRMIQGPIAPESGATARFGAGLREGFRNLPITAFTFYINSDAVYRDPNLGTPYGAAQLYNNMQGRLFAGGSHVDPHTKTPTNFPLAGDPATGAGWIDGDVHQPSDRRMLLSSGPFTMARGDTQEVVYAYLVAQRPLLREEIVELRKASDILQLCHDNPACENILPEISHEIVYFHTDSSELIVRAALLNSSSARAIVRDKQGIEIARFMLFDDGLHGDGSAGDFVYSASWITPRRHAGVDFTVEAGYDGDKRMEWPGGVCIPLAGQVSARLHRIESDHLNFDGAANPGENVRFSAAVRNSTPFDAGAVKVYARDFEPRRPEFIETPFVSSNSETVRPYDPFDELSYLSFDVPAAATDGEIFLLPVSINDTVNNCWCDTLELAAQAFASPPADSLTRHISGPGTGALGYRVVDRGAMKDHTYVVHIEGEETDAQRYVTIEDATDARVLLTRRPLPSLYAHEMPVVDGWKLTLGTANSNWLDYDADPIWRLEEEMLSVEYMPSGNKWFIDYIPFGTGHAWGWGTRTGLMELYAVALVFDPSSPQKAYGYLRGGTPNYGCTGYHEIPVSAWDIRDPSSPRRIELAFVEQLGGPRANNTWDPRAAADRE